MIRTLARLALTIAALLVFQGSALAQKGGGGGGGGAGGGMGGNGNGNRQQPKQPLTGDEVLKSAQVLFGLNAETQTAEQEGLAKLTYKAITTDLEGVLKQLSGEYRNRLAQGGDPVAQLRQFLPQVVEGMNAYLTEPEGWKFEAQDDLKWKGKKIGREADKVSLVTDGDQITALVLTQPAPPPLDGKKAGKAPDPIKISFKKEKAEKNPFAKLKLELKGITDKKTEKIWSFDIRAEALSVPSKTSEPLKAEPPKEEKKDEPKKEEPKKDVPKQDVPKQDVPKQDE